MAKPIGPICNLNCGYCFYLSAEAMYDPGERFRMSDNVLEAYVRQAIAAAAGPRVDFAWQGGEPTLMGLDFFRKAVDLQKRLLPKGWQAANAVQTNGTLLDDDWCRFFKDESFLVGISLDGPALLHDAYRVDKGGRPTHAEVMRGLRLLQAHGVEYNVLCVVSDRNARAPLDVYRFFKEAGVNWMQFIPLVERGGTGASVSADAYGRFLVAIFDEWVRFDIGRVFVQLFEECVRVWSGYPAGLCVYAETCGRALILEHDGEVYACDHFVAPEHRLGNIQDTSLAGLAGQPAQIAFGQAKRDALPAQCRTCDVKFICNGGCPKDRLLTTADGEPGLNYLCEGYRRFFRHAAPRMRRIAAQLQQDDAARWKAAGRNDPCPCGSGRKFKVCCLPRRTG